MTTVTVSNETEIKTNDFCVNNICLALRGEYPVLVFGLILSKDTSVKKNRFICVEKQDEDQEAEYKIKTYIEEYIQFQHQALQNIRSALPPNKSLIGFTGGPITLYHFAIRNNPIADNLFEQALPVLQKLIEKNIAIQFQNDIDLLMIFDTEANQLTDQEFQDFCLPFIKQIADQYPNQIGYFTKNISPNKFELLKQISSLQLTVLGTQHNIFQELSQTHLSLQGNFSNDLLTIPEKSDFLSALEEYIDLCKSYHVSQRNGWIASLDHGVQKITPETNIHLFIDQIRTKLA